VGRAQITSEKTGTDVLGGEAGIINLIISPFFKETSTANPNPSSLISKQIPFPLIFFGRFNSVAIFSKGTDLLKIFRVFDLLSGLDSNAF
jgi:hypothetical protein